jgi:hypothetical protein
MKRWLALSAFVAIASAVSSAAAQEEGSDSADKRRGLRVEVVGGVDYRSLFGLQIWGGDVGMRLGSQIRPWIGIYGETSYFRGSTRAGLTTQMVLFGPRVDMVVFEGLHLGCGAEGAYFDIARASELGSISTWGVGLLGFVRYDVFDSAPYAVFVEGRMDGLSLDTLGNPTTMWTGALDVGLRF